MLDIKKLRENPDEISRRLALRGKTYDLQAVLALDQDRRRLQTETEKLKSERNSASKEIGRMKKAGESTDAMQESVRKTGERIAEIDAELKGLEQRQHEAMLMIPNLPHASVPAGASEADNQLVRTWGSPREFSFTPAPHWDIGARLRILDFERAARMSGAGFPLFRGAGARLERALIQFMLDLHTTQHGYTEIAPPFLCGTDAMTGTGQLPKMAEDMYQLAGEQLYLIPTAEVPVTNIYREEIISEPLPLSFVAYTPCFRREAGAAGKLTRGLNRLHQFDKVELVKIVEPAKSYEAHEQIVSHAEAVLRKLGLHYRVLELCTADISFAAAKCYDLELWAPGQNAWLEVSSCSNFEDFQARRAGIRYRNAEGRVEYVHTLNGSGVALARLYVAILENFQEADGSVVIPEVLRPYMGGLERIQPAS